MRGQQGQQQRLLHIARADHPCGHAVDGAVKEIQADQRLIAGAAAHDFIGNAAQVVRQRDHMVAVPVHGAGYVQRQLIVEGQLRGDFVRDGLLRVVVAIVQQIVHAGLPGRVGGVKFVAANSVGFQPNAEYLAFHAVDHARQGLGKDLIQAVAQAQARG